jgi:hypothetical protein
LHQCKAVVSSDADFLLQFRDPFQNPTATGFNGQAVERSWTHGPGISVLFLGDCPSIVLVSLPDTQAHRLPQRARFADGYAKTTTSLR